MRVRPTTLDDDVQYRSILARTSEEDRYFRFFRAVDALDPDDVRRAVERRDDMIAMVAEDGRVALGIAHAALLEDRAAELAVLVADDARGYGIGKALLSALITYLQNLGYERFIAHSLQDNAGFAHLAHSVGLSIEHVEGADIRWSLVRSRIPALVS